MLAAVSQSEINDMSGVPLISEIEAIDESFSIFKFPMEEKLIQSNVHVN